MSSLPGHYLEDFIIWNYDLVVEDAPEANFSLGIAEALGTIPRRTYMSKAKFKELLPLFEPYRKDVEAKLDDFDEETQSWRDYSDGVACLIPDVVYLAFDVLAATDGVWKHAKRGSSYLLVAQAEVQASTRPLQEGDTVTAYIGGQRKWYVRLNDEFHDGRFIRKES